MIFINSGKETTSVIYQLIILNILGISSNSLFYPANCLIPSVALLFFLNHKRMKSFAAQRSYCIVDLRLKCISQCFVHGITISVLNYAVRGTKNSIRAKDIKTKNYLNSTAILHNWLISVTEPIVSN